LRVHPDNRYHRWLVGDGENSRGIVRGDWGLSYAAREPVAKIIGERMFWSVLLAVISIALAYLISIPLGVRMASKPGRFFDRGASALLFILFSMPVFWTATLLLMMFSNPDALQWFPVSGVKPPQGYPAGASLWARIGTSLPFLVPPVACYTYGAVAFLSRTMRASMLDVLGRPFIRTARAKGLSPGQVLYRHALRNALLPMITVFAGVFPLAISGSVVIESIFSIPGMGLETFQAVRNLDYPVITAVFTLTGLLTLTGYLLSDLMYAAVDPRIAYARRME
jgi:peptide/nickel transport system permease protein